MKTCLLVILVSATLCACDAPPTAPYQKPVGTNTVKPTKTWKSEQQRRAGQWLAPLKLNDPEKEDRLEKVIATHVLAVREWHNQQVEKLRAETNTVADPGLSAMDRLLAADAELPKSVHADLMTGLQQDLTPEQIEFIEDAYTSRRVPVTLKTYHAIVPDLTPEEETAIIGLLKQARTEAVDYKSPQEIAAIFERYKTKCQDYLISKGRDWNALASAYAQLHPTKRFKETNEATAKPAE